MGRATPSSSARSAESTSARRSAEAGFATINAKGLPLRCLRSRSRATASALKASQARWKPPSPLMATILPAFSAARMSPMECDKCGPQSGQAVGWAWKRRSAGSAYSAAQAGQSGKAAMEVFGRS